MNMFDTFILSVIVIIFPILCYLFYIVTDKNIDTKRKNLVLIFTLISVYYLLYKNFISTNHYYLLITIPIFIAYKKNYKLLFILFLISSCLILYKYNNLYILFFIIEQLLVLIVNRNKNSLWNIIIISIINILYFLLFSNNAIIYDIIYVLIYTIIQELTIYTIITGESVINYNIEYKDLKKENELRRSLFKITHEIKNPLAVIKAYIDIFDCNDIESSKKYISIISGEIDKVLLLLQDFLLVNKENINFDIMDMNVLIDMVDKTLREINHLSIKVECDNDEELFIKGDYNRLSQVLINIIKNSYEAHADNVIVKSYIDNDDVIIEISDNGDGIDEKLLNKIYEPFFTTKPDGTGLGVPLSKEIIEAHNGTIDYYNNCIKGTMVRICLPLLNM